MTLNDIGRLLKIANVPRSKTVQHSGLAFILHVPATHFVICANVVGRMKLPTDNISVVLLDPSHADVPDGAHVFYKVKGDTAAAARPYDDALMPEAYFRNHRMRTARARNASVVIDCASVTLS